MDVREKLVKLIENGVPCPDGRDPFGEYCDTCRYSESADCSNERLADYLISHNVTVQEWIPVTERLPEEKVNYIIRYNHAYCDNDGYWAIGFCFYDGEKFQIDLSYKVTHWMPLPEPPKGE